MNVIEKTTRNTEYIDENGNFRCVKCNDIVLEAEYRDNAIMSGFRLKCSCDKQREKAEQDRIAAEKTNERRKNCFEGVAAMYNHTFANDKYIEDKAGQIARKYVDGFQTIREKKQNGLMFYGSVGTGKSFYAAAIANALTDKGLHVRYTSLQRILSTVDINDRPAYINVLKSCDLLILDDFGRESNSPYAQQIAFEVIDGRTSSQKPLIVTTNFSISRISNPANDDEARLFNRILLACFPVEVNAVCKRTETAKQLYNENKQFYNA